MNVQISEKSDNSNIHTISGDLWSVRDFLCAYLRVSQCELKEVYPGLFIGSLFEDAHVSVDIEF